MKSGVLAAFALVAAAALAAEEQMPASFAILDAMVEQQLKTGNFSEASKELVKLLLEEHKQAFLKDERKLAYTGLPDAKPDVKNHNEYVGKYTQSPDKPDASTVELALDGKGRFVVRSAGTELPAVAYNMSILFTTGEVVHANVPNLGARPHATLEFLAIARINGQYCIKSPCSPHWPGTPLKKLPQE